MEPARGDLQRAQPRAKLVQIGGRCCIWMGCMAACQVGSCNCKSIPAAATASLRHTFLHSYTTVNFKGMCACAHGHSLLISSRVNTRAALDHLDESKRPGTRSAKPCRQHCGLPTTNAHWPLPERAATRPAASTARTCCWQRSGTWPASVTYSRRRESTLREGSARTENNYTTDCTLAPPAPEGHAQNRESESLARSMQIVLIEESARCCPWCKPHYTALRATHL